MRDRRQNAPPATVTLALGPHPQRELTMMPRRGFAWPRLGMAAGAREGQPGPSALAETDDAGDAFCHAKLRVCEPMIRSADATPKWDRLNP